jgi:hypothetical protein
VAVPSKPLQLSDFGLPEEPARPVQFALSCVFVQNLSAFIAIVEETHALVSQSVVKPDEADVVGKLKSALPLVENARELSHWVYPPAEPLTVAEARSKADALQQAGLEPDLVEQMLRVLQKRSVGKPAKRRGAFIAAFELMLQSKKNSLNKAVREFCPCGGNHTPECHQRFKTGIHDLKKILRKYAPDLVPQYDALHPDRTKKVAE